MIIQDRMTDHNITNLDIEHEEESIFQYLFTCFGKYNKLYLLVLCTAVFQNSKELEVGTHTETEKQNTFNITIII